MARILCVITGLKGMTNATFALLDRLQNLGHDVCFSTFQDFEEQNKNAPFQYYSLAKYKRYDSSALQPTGSGNTILRKIWDVLSRKSTRKQLEQLLENDLRVYERLIKKVKPDLVFIDVELSAYIAFTKSNGIKHFIYSQWFNMKPGRNIPPINSAFTPSDTTESIEKTHQLWTKHLSNRRKSHFKKAFSFRIHHEAIIHKFVEKHLMKSSLVQNPLHPHIVHTEGETILHSTYSELDWPRKQQENHIYLSGLVFKNRKDFASTSVGQTISQIIDLKTKNNLNLICLTFSSMKTEAGKFELSLTKKVVAAIHRRPDWIGIIRGKQEWFDLDETQPNIYFFENLPLLTVLKHADCAINHGGINTINECIEFNVPMLLYHGNQFDQNGCVARMGYHKMAVIGDTANDTEEDIERKIVQTMTSEEIKSNMKALTSPKTKKRYLNKLETLVNQALSE